MYRNPVKAYIDIGALKNNLNIVRNKFPGKRIILPVKANAYGHGDLIVAKCAESLGVDFFAVARINEGVALRAGGIKSRIMVLGSESYDNIECAVLHDIELSVSSSCDILDIIKMIAVTGKCVTIHLNIDTGMSRLGVAIEELPFLLKLIASTDKLKFGSVFTHFAMSDESFEVTEMQMSKFRNAYEIINRSGVVPDFFHSCNSGGVENTKDDGFTKAMRPGIMVYGYSQKINTTDNDGLIPVMSLVSEVIHVKKVACGTHVGYGHSFTTDKETYLATVPVGYGDGLMRAVSNKLKVRINGKDYMECGRLSMDLMVVEVDSSVSIGDSVVVFGNKKIASMDAVDLATICDTISYEITTNISSRVDRVCVDGVDQGSIKLSV